jgi:alkylation response protein AidB-like acyl-CoA dehydrogenase
MSAALDVAGRGRPDPVARARALLPLIAEAAPRIEAARALTPEVLDALHGARLFRTLLPEVYGGEEVRPAIFVRMQEAIASADASTAWCLGQASGCSMAAAYMAPEIAREIWGRDPRAAIAWGMGNGVAEVVPGGYRVSGKWRFASGSRHATWIGAHCKVKEPDGSWRHDGDGVPTERTMMFRREAVRITEDWNVVGLRGTGSDTYAVAEAFVPEAYSLRRDTDAERRLPGPLYQFSTTHLYASGFAGVSLGIARAMLDAFREMAMAKTPSASARPMRESEVIQVQGRSAHLEICGQFFLGGEPAGRFL